MLGAAIFAYLDGITAAEDRVYPLTLPDRAHLPALTYQVVGDDTLVTHSDAQAHPTYTGRRYENTRVQFDAYAPSYDEVEALASELRSAITGYRGQWGDVQIESVLPAPSLDEYEPGVGKFRRITDFYITWIAGAEVGS